MVSSKHKQVRGKQLPRSEKEPSLPKEVLRVKRLRALLFCGVLWAGGGANSPSTSTDGQMDQDVLRVHETFYADRTRVLSPHEVTFSSFCRVKTSSPYLLTTCLPHHFTRKDAITKEGRKDISWEEKSFCQWPSLCWQRMLLRFYGAVLLLTCENMGTVLPFVDRYLGTASTEQRASSL